MSLKARLQEDVNTALRAGDKARVSVLRLALAAIQRREVDSRRQLDDSGVQAVLEKLIKQGEEAAAQYSRGGRTDLVDKETAEIAVLRTYLPKPMDEGDIEALISAAIESTGATSPKDIGKVMQHIKSEAAGRADMAAINARVRALLSSD
jgi:uncharacterized protein YqeY